MIHRYVIYGYIVIESENYSAMLVNFNCIAIKPLKNKGWYKYYSYEEIRPFIHFSIFDEFKVLQISDIEFDNALNKLFALNAFS